MRYLETLRLGRLAVAALGVVVVTAACAAGGEQSPAATALPEPNAALQGTVVIGAVLPLTGTNATIGKDQKRGIDLAVADINSRNGVLGKRLEVKVEDSEGRADAAIQAARKLVGVDKVPAVIGEYSSGITIPLQQFLQSSNVVGVNSGSSSTEIRNTGPLQFSVIGLDDVAGAFTAKALRDKGYQTIAVLAPNNAYGSGIVKSVSAAFQKLGGKVTTSGLYNEGQADYRQELQRLRDSNPDAYVLTTYGKDGTTINSQAFELGMTDKPVFDIYLSQDVPDADPASVQGRVGMDVNSIAASGKAYQESYRKAFGEEFISSFNGLSYDAVSLLAAAIDKAGGTDPAAIAAALPQVSDTFVGVTGPLKLDQDGQRVDQPYVIATVDDGRIVPQ